MEKLGHAPIFSGVLIAYFFVIFLSFLPEVCSNMSLDSVRLVSRDMHIWLWLGWNVG